MPTGYTEPIYNGKGISFRDFTLRCARAMGALIVLRDEPTDTPLPKRLEPHNEYSTAELAKAELRMAELWSMDAEQIAREHAQVRADKLAERVKDAVKMRDMRARYNAMIEQVERWMVGPPLVGLREFMLQQLTEGREFDCPEGRASYPPEPAADPIEWYEAEVKAARWSLDYHAEQIAKENERTRERNNWLAALRRSLPLPNHNAGLACDWPCPTVKAQRKLGWRWHVQQALWDAIQSTEITTWSDAAGLTELVAKTLKDNGFGVICKAEFDSEGNVI